MKVSYITLVFFVVEISLGTYLAIHQEIPFLWAFFSIYGFGVFRNSVITAIEKHL